MASLKLIKEAGEAAVRAVSPAAGKAAKGISEVEAASKLDDESMEAFFSGLNLQAAALDAEARITKKDSDLVKDFDGTVLQDELTGMTPEGGRLEGEEVYKEVVSDLRQGTEGTAFAGSLGTNVDQIGTKYLAQRDRVNTLWKVSGRMPAYTREDPDAVSMVYDLYRDIERGIAVPDRISKSLDTSGLAVDVFMKVLEEIPPVKVQSPEFVGKNKYEDLTEDALEHARQLKLSPFTRTPMSADSLATRMEMRAKAEVMNNRRFHPDLVLSGEARQNFAKWLGKDSKRDPEGNPLVVFRTGTPISKSEGGYPLAFGGGSEFSAHFGGVDAALDASDTDVFRMESLFRSFTFSSADKKKAVDIYYIRFKNDIEIPDVGNFNPENVRAALLETQAVRSNPELSARLKKIDINMEDNEATSESAQAIKDVLEEYGYDALSYINTAEAPGSRSYLPFRPTQVKSIRNFGSFDPNVDNVMRAIVGPALVGTGAATTAVPKNTEEEM